MKKYCPICFRKISTHKNGRICRHGFKKNRWIFDGKPTVKNNIYKQVDSSSCQGSGQFGLTLIQLEKLKNDRK